MQSSISFTSVLPALVTLTGTMAAVWLAFWLAAFGLQRWSQRKAAEDRFSRPAYWLNAFTGFLRRATGFAAIVIATLIMLHGVGIQGFHRITWDELSAWISGSGLPILFILGSAFVLIRAHAMLTRSLPGMLVPSRAPLAERLDRRKRIETRGRLARWIVTAVVLAIAGVMTLQTLGFNVKPLLAGGAIASVALGFGAQNLVRDFISGLFFILEDQIRVGDIATINGKGGQVEAIHLRTLSLRGLDGTVHIFPNGSITELSNMTKNFSYYVIDLGIAYKENVDGVMQRLRGIGEELLRDPGYKEKILAPLEILGVDDFAASAVIIKLRIKTVPLEQWNVGRELRRRIKNDFDEAGIELPFPHLSVYFGEASKPVAHMAVDSRANA